MKSPNHPITISLNVENSIFAVNIENFSKKFNEGLLLVASAMQKDILRFKFEKDRHRKLISALLLRYMVKNFLHISNYSVSTNSHGKPSIDNYLDFQFNISHSGNRVVAAVSDKPLGIDIELISDLDDFMDIAKRFYSAEEYLFLLECEESSRLDLFYSIWTKKESLIKAVGKGLSLPLNSFTVPFKPDGLIENNGKCWSLFIPEIGDDHYKISICFSSNQQLFAPVKYLTLDQLVN